jgi:WhiB family redox-sensing transcriptional regulator
VAKRICLGCDVRATCLEDALEIRAPHGIWGGRTELERQAQLDALG